MAYWPHPELPYPFMTLIVRTSADPLRWAGPIQEQVRALDKDLPVSKVRTMEQWISESVAQARFSTFLLATFAGVALALAVVGIYRVDGLRGGAAHQRNRHSHGAGRADQRRPAHGRPRRLRSGAHWSCGRRRHCFCDHAIAAQPALRDQRARSLDIRRGSGIAVGTGDGRLRGSSPARDKVDPMSALHHE